VVTDKRNAAKKAPLEIIGHYLPTRDPAEFVFKKDRVEFHLKNGAAPTDTVARLLSKEGVKGLEKFVEKYTKQKKRKEVEEKEVAAPAPTEAPAEEAKEEKEEKEAEETPKEEAPAEEVKEEEKAEEEPSEANAADEAKSS
tara:strand:- start:633 stop:1055 length:423 start_codon:yes stop_codon:yes gene_type:complete